MRAAIFNPYLDTLGGGERYTISFAKVLVNAGYSVDIQWCDENISYKLEKRFGIKLTDLNFIKDIKRGDGYDICFWVSDGSIPILRSRRNFLHFQIPFTDVNGKSLLNRMKLFRINKIIVNSYFTKGFIDDEYGVESIVIYPPVDVNKIKPKKKENIILFVGRFSQLQQAKNQHILVDVFKKFFNLGYRDWRLVLAGGSEIGAKEYLRKLKKLSLNYPVEILKGLSFDSLKDLYGKSKLFWSAVGFAVNENKEPNKMEHFGITIVEAMAAGCVPIIYSGGGHKEIIGDDVNGMLWSKKHDLLKETIEVIENRKKYRMLAKAAKESSLIYEYERFEAEVNEIIK